MNSRRRNIPRPLDREEVILNQVEPGQGPQQSIRKERVLEYMSGNVKQVFRQKADGQLELLKSVPISNGTDGRRAFRLKPMPTELRGKLPHKTYKIFAPSLNIDYRFYQANGVWDKVHDPKKEKIVLVDDETARSLETMSNEFEEVIVKALPKRTQEPEEKTVAFVEQPIDTNDSDNGDDEEQVEEQEKEEPAHGNE